MADEFREEGSEGPSLCERLRIFRESLGLDQREFAKLTDTAFRTYQDYELGKSPPKVSFIQKLVALGAEPAWILGSGGLSPLDASPAAPRGGGSISPPNAIDDELLGRVTDAIARLYKDERISLAPIDLGRLAGRRYSEIITATNDPAERLAMIKLMVVQLRRELHASAAEPGRGKASA